MFKKFFQTVIFICLLGCFINAETMQARPDIRPINDNDIIRISGTYGEERNIEGNWHFHSGIDFAALFGKKLKAVADGKVYFAGQLDGYGWTIIIKHEFIQREARFESGQWKIVSVPYVIYSLVAHCSKQWVIEGQNVKKNQVIAEVGTTGRTNGSHVHYELRSADHTPIFNGTFQRRDGIEQGRIYANMTREEIVFQKLLRGESANAKKAN